MLQTSLMLHTLVAIPGQLRVLTPRLAALATTIMLSCTFPAALTVGASRLSAQGPFTRLVHVTVTEPSGRFVTGLRQEHFQVVENGVRRAITDFSSDPPPISLAIVSDGSLPAVGRLNGPEDELIQTRSLSGALRQLAASKNSRKVLLVTAAVDNQAIPAGIEVLQTDPGNLLRTVIELNNQYLLQFESSTPSAAVEIVLQRPAGLPLLRPTWR